MDDAIVGSTATAVVGVVLATDFVVAAKTQPKEKCQWRDPKEELQGTKQKGCCMENTVVVEADRRVRTSSVVVEGSVVDTTHKEKDHYPLLGREKQKSKAKSKAKDKVDSRYSLLEGEEEKLAVVVAIRLREWSQKATKKVAAFHTVVDRKHRAEEEGHQ